MKKIISIILGSSLLFFGVQSARAGVREGFSSLVLPGTGQVMNGQASDFKTKVFGAVEIASIATTAILGGFVGGPVIWAGLGPLIANHLWSSADAHHNAQGKQQGFYGQPQPYQIAQSQRALELSHQQRFENEQSARSDIRDRIMQAGELAGR